MVGTGGLRVGPYTCKKISRDETGNVVDLFVVKERSKGLTSLKSCSWLTDFVSGLGVLVSRILAFCSYIPY